MRKKETFVGSLHLLELKINTTLGSFLLVIHNNLADRTQQWDGASNEFLPYQLSKEV